MGPSGGEGEVGLAFRHDRHGDAWTSHDVLLRDPLHVRRGDLEVAVEVFVELAGVAGEDVEVVEQVGAPTKAASGMMKSARAINLFINV